MKRLPDQTKTVDWIDYWLVVLGRAVSAGDHRRTAEAFEELRRIGIEVSLRWIDNVNPQEPIHAG